MNVRIGDLAKVVDKRKSGSVVGLLRNVLWQYRNDSNVPDAEFLDPGSIVLVLSEDDHLIYVLCSQVGSTGWISRHSLRRISTFDG